MIYHSFVKGGTRVVHLPYLRLRCGGSGGGVVVEPTFKKYALKAEIEAKLEGERVYISGPSFMYIVVRVQEVTEVRRSRL